MILQLRDCKAGNMSSIIAASVAAISCNVGGGGTKCRGNEGVRMPLLSGTDIIFLVNYIITIWLKNSKLQGGRSRRQIPGDASPAPPGIAAHEQHPMLYYPPPPETWKNLYVTLNPGSQQIYKYIYPCTFI